MKKWNVVGMAAVLGIAAITVHAYAADKLKVGFIYVGPIGDLGWSYQHDLGRKAMEKALGDKVESTFLENVPEGADAERSIEQLARTGHKLIFTTSFGFMDATVKVAAKYPNVMFEHATGFKRAKNLSTYAARFYEGRYIQGQIAAKVSKSGHRRLHRLVPDPRGHLQHQRHHARSAIDQSEHEVQDRLGEFLVRSGQGSRRRQGAG
jgi:basic membrane protein A and related proteins